MTVNLATLPKAGAEKKYKQKEILQSKIFLHNKGNNKIESASYELQQMLVTHLFINTKYVLKKKYQQNSIVSNKWTKNWAKSLN